MYHPFLEGKRIYLRGLEKKDLSGRFFQWANDKEVTHYLFMGVTPNILQNLEDWFEENRKSDGDIVFMIIDKESDQEIGFCGFHVIRWLHRHAEYRVFIGEKGFRGKKYGQETAKLMLRYGFELLNLNKVWLGVSISHSMALNSYIKSGFVKEGVLRQEIYRNSRYYDAIRLSILRDEYYSKHKQEWDREFPNIFEKE